MPDWPNRAMQFVDIRLRRPEHDPLRRDADQHRLSPTLLPDHGHKTAPLIVEAESAYRDLDATSANGIAYVRDNLCFPLAAGSFEEGMGA